MSGPTYRVGTDIGGTFTDCVVVDDAGTVTTAKAPSTPRDFSAGFFDALTTASERLGIGLEAMLGCAEVVVHATTAGTNAVVQRDGADVALLTTSGHDEAILIMRGAGRTKGLDVDEMLFLAGTRNPEPLVPRRRILPITERIDSAGRVVVALDEGQVRALVGGLVADGVRSIAVALLWSVANPAHELRIRELVAEVAPDVFVSCSHEVAPRVGEYARTVATVVNSYIGPMMRGYTDRIVDRAAAGGSPRAPLFAQCLGGVASHAAIRATPILTLDSGPVSGIVACAHLGALFGHPNIVSADMGGTTFDVSVIADGEPQRRDTTILNQYELYLPVVDVESIGAGGGSIAWIDPGTSTMKVGPRSAGSEPGPACYGFGGTEATVTDADVVLGVVDPDNFLGGRRRLDADAARAAVARLGDQLGLGPEETAAGIAAIVDTAMAEKMRRMTVFRGHDPRDFVVYAFGGAGPTHAGAFAKELGVRGVVVPLGETASVLSALGTVCTDIGHVLDRNVLLSAPLDTDRLSAVFAELETQAVEQLEREGFAPGRRRLTRAVAMKYGAQVYDLEIPVDRDMDGAGIVARFEESYATRFGRGSGYRPAGITLLRCRVYAAGLLPRPSLVRDDAHAARSVAPTATSRPVWWPQAGGPLETPVWRGLAQAPAGTVVEGPAVADCGVTTVPVAPGDRLEVDGHGNLLLSFGPSGATGVPARATAP